MTYRTLEQEQIGIYFQMGASMDEAALEALFAVHDAAYAAVEKAFLATPEFERTDATVSADFRYNPYELCECSGEVEERGKRPLFSVWFHSSCAVPDADLRALKKLCVTAYESAVRATGVEVAYEKVVRHRVWRVSESSVVLDV